MEMNFTKSYLTEVFPLNAVIDGAIVSKKGDVTFAWKLGLPAITTQGESAYDAMIGRLSAAIRNLPPYTIVHKQDSFNYRKYQAGTPSGFLADSYERHFDGRPYLCHECRIFLTFSSKDAMWHSPLSSSLFGIKPFVKDKTAIGGLFSKAREFQTFLSQCPGLSVTPIAEDELTGDESHPGLIQRYMMLGRDDNQLSGIMLEPDSVKVFDRKMICYSVSDADQMPSSIPSVLEDRQLASANTRVETGLGSVFGLRLNCEHVVNQYIAVLPQASILRSIDSKRKKMKSGGIQSVDNRRNSDEMTEVLEAANGGSVRFVKSHINVMAWTDDSDTDELKGIIGSALSDMGINGVYNNFNTPVLYFAGIPGAESELSRDDYMTVELESALCPWIWDTFESPVDGGRFKVCDRFRNVPIALDMGEVAMQAGLIDNFNGFILGPSGSGKSYFTNFFLRQSYDAGNSIFVVDIGDSYEGLCKVINEESRGKDGIYNVYDGNHPLSLNPFVGYTERVDGKNASLQYLEGLFKTIWVPERGWNKSNSSVLTSVLTSFMEKCRKDKLEIPTFDMFRNYVGGDLKKAIDKGSFKCGGSPVGKDDFDCENFSKAMFPFSSEGTYPLLLNNPEPVDHSDCRFVVYELSSVCNDELILSVVTSTIMHDFERMMRRKKGFKMLVIDEAWKAISNETMSPKLMELWRTARKHSAAAVVVTQDVADIRDNDVIKTVIVNNSAVKILLDHSNSQNSFGVVQETLGLSAIETSLALSVRRHGLNPRYRYREAFISLGGRKSGVYGIETSPEEQVAYQSAKEAKAVFLQNVERYGSAVKAINETLK